jgi:hypothetical protein
MYLHSHIYKNIPVSYDFITTWNQGVFLCLPCISISWLGVFAKVACPQRTILFAVDGFFNFVLGDFIKICWKRWSMDKIRQKCQVDVYESLHRDTVIKVTNKMQLYKLIYYS